MQSTDGWLCTPSTGGSAAAVAAGVDSLEHGMWLDDGLLDAMREKGITLVPTLSVFLAHLDQARTGRAGPGRDWFVNGAERHGALVVSAYEAGVQVLAGTDSMPHGRVVDEVRALAAAGLPVEAAIGAASWTARNFLRLPGLEPGGLADAVGYDADPRADLAVLEHPQWVLARGRVLRHVAPVPAT